MIHEAVLISEKATLNSKSERKGYKIVRLTVEKSSWEQLKTIELDEAADSKLDKEMLLVRNKVKAYRVAKKSISDNNFPYFSRKRKSSVMDQSDAMSKNLDQS